MCSLFLYSHQVASLTTTPCYQTKAYNKKVLVVRTTDLSVDSSRRFKTLLEWKGATTDQRLTDEVEWTRYRQFAQSANSGCKRSNRSPTAEVDVGPNGTNCATLVAVFDPVR